jgi:hypothetical protein
VHDSCAGAINANRISEKTNRRKAIRLNIISIFGVKIRMKRMSKVLVWKKKEIGSWKTEFRSEQKGRQEAEGMQ